MKITPVGILLLFQGFPSILSTLANVVVAHGQRVAPTNLRGHTRNRNHKPRDNLDEPDRRDTPRGLFIPQRNDHVTISEKQRPSSVLKTGDLEEKKKGRGIVNHGTTNGQQARQKLLGDWEFCSTSDECDNGCCSIFYSDDGRFRCTPLEGGFQSDLCTVLNVRRWDDDDSNVAWDDDSSNVGWDDDTANDDDSNVGATDDDSNFGANDDDSNFGATDDDSNFGANDDDSNVGANDDDSNVGANDDDSLYLADWELCSTSEECGNGCCSNSYSDDEQFRCTPLEGGFNADWCIESNNGATDDDSTTATSPPDSGSSGPQYGLQPDCYQDDSSRFNICFDLSSLDGSYKSWMDSVLGARDRWESVIVGDTFSARDGQDLQGTNVATTLPPFIDDLYIAVFESDIDGSNNVLGFAYATVVLTDSAGNRLPVAGEIYLDIADVDRGEIRGLIEHEMGHVLGFGTLFDENGIHSGKENDSQYTGTSALQAWRDMGCSGDIPIETDGGSGTAGGHWDEECLVGELMTGYLGEGNYLSRLTIGAMEDLGYSVNMNAADSFSLDQLSQSQCTAYCPEATGALSTATTGTSTSSTSTIARDKVAETKERHAIMTVAATTLQRNQATRPLSLPEGYRYVGGDSISIFTHGSNGRVQETTVTWQDVELFLKSPPSLP